MAVIPLSGSKGQGLFMWVDDEDYPRMSERKWYYHLGYAISVQHVCGSPSRSDRVQRSLVAHRYLLDLRKGCGIVDHINGNRLDNRRSNLRVTDALGNARNARPYGASGYKGVKRESANCFSAKLKNEGLGYYRTARGAALAVDKAARSHYGEYAYLNFPSVVDYSGLEAIPPRNTGPRTSDVVGVSYARKRKAKNKWRAVFCRKHIGWFASEQEAADALKEYKDASC